MGERAKGSTAIYEHKVVRIIGPSAIVRGLVIVEFLGNGTRALVLPSTLTDDTFGQRVQKMLTGHDTRGFR